MKILRKLFFLFSALTALFSIAQGYTLRETLRKEIPLGAGGNLVLEDVNGSIEVRQWDRNTFLIQAEKIVTAFTREEAEACLRELKIKIDTSGSRITIRTLMPNRKGDGFFEWLFSSSCCTSCEVKYKLSVPADVHMKLTTVNGKITLRSATGEADVSTTNGEIVAEDFHGTLRANSTNGSIEATIGRLTNPVQTSLRTVNGSVALYLPNDARCDIEASTVNGSIHTDFPAEISGNSGSHRLHASINGGGPAVKLSTVNGSIRIRKAMGED